MGLFARTRAYISGIWKSLGASIAGSTLASWAASLVGPRRGLIETLDAFGTSPWFHAATKRIAQESATKYYPELYDRPVGHPQRRQIHDHPLLDLLYDPLPGRLPASLVWYIFWLCREISGDGFLYIERNAAGYPCGLLPIAPHWVRSIPTQTAPYFDIDCGTFRAHIAPRDMLWMPDPNPRDPHGRGTSTARALASEIDISEYSSQYLRASFQNGATPSLIVTVDGASKESLEGLRSQWSAQFQGPKQSNKAFFFPGGKINTQVVATSNRDLQLIDIRRHERDTIVQVENIPPELFGILENSNRATVDAAYYLFAMAVLVPRMRLLSEYIEMRLAQEFETRPGRKTIYVSHRNPVPEDRDFILRGIATAPSAIKVGDLRRLLGLPPSDRDEEWLTEAGANAGPTNVPPGKAWNRESARLQLLEAGCREDALDKLIASIDWRQSAH